MAHDFIIGVDILKPNRFIVNYDDNILTCHSVSVPIQSVTPVKTQLIHANCSIKLLPNTTDIIWVKCDLPNVNLLVNTCGRIKSTPTVVTMCTEGTHEHHIPIHLANTTPSAIHINRGDVIASVSEANILCSINSENDFDTFILRETNNFDTVNSITPSRPWKPSERIKNNNKNLTTDLKHALNRLIDVYYMVFARNDEDIGRIPDSYGTHYDSSAYVDDILTYSKTFDDHLIHLKALFDRLKTANIKIKTSKCHIASDNIMFLGYQGFYVSMIHVLNP